MIGGKKNQRIEDLEERNAVLGSQLERERRQHFTLKGEFDDLKIQHDHAQAMQRRSVSDEEAAALKKRVATAESEVANLQRELKQEQEKFSQGMVWLKAELDETKQALATARSITTRYQRKADRLKQQLVKA